MSRIRESNNGVAVGVPGRTLDTHGFLEGEMSGMKAEWRHARCCSMLVGLLAAFFHHAPHAETLVAWDASPRLTLAFQVPEAALQKWLPDGWKAGAVAAGPSKGANLVLAFVDRMLNLDPEGKPINGGSDRYLGLVVPAVPPAGGKPESVVIRLYQSNPGAVPGVYKNAVPAKVSMEQVRRGSDTAPSDGTETWTVQDATGGIVSLRLKYRGGPLVRIKQEPKFYSAIQPDFYRIYRFEQASDVVRSVANGVDRVDELAVEVGIAELKEMFDGNEKLVSVVVTPWYARQIFLP